MSNFKGSSAQRNVVVSTTFQYQTSVGDNYKTVAVFLEQGDVAANLKITLSNNSYVYVTSADYGDTVEGTLKQWLDSFFAVNSVSRILIVAFATGDSGVQAAFDAVQYRAFFKTMFYTTESVAYKGDVTKLAQVCTADAGFSECWVHTIDPQSIVDGSVTSLAYQIATTGNADAVMFYKADGVGNATLTQLGLTLASVNISGTPVGNYTDYQANLIMSPSGASGVPLTASVINILKAKNIGFFTYVNESALVQSEGLTTLKGNTIGVRWLTAYIEYIVKNNLAAFLASGVSFKTCLLYTSPSPRDH
jgi:hypothetical protein